MANLSIRIPLGIVLLLSLFIACSAQDDSCIKNPVPEACKNFVYPESRAAAMVKDLCISMKHMPMCSVNQVCEANPSLPDRQYCDPTSLMKGICNGGMSMMSDCTDYRTMCMNNQTHVPACAMKVIEIPSSSDLNSLIVKICGRMSMDSCDTCIQKGVKIPCNALETYSNLCLEMPGMDECKSWKSMCKEIPDWPFCSVNVNGNAVEMRMYFHTGIVDYILFKDWVPRTWPQYFLSCFAIVVISFLYEALKWGRSVMERRLTNSTSYQLVNETMGGSSSPAFNLKVDLLRATVHFLEVMWGLGVMLVAMTYNVGLFFCVGIGAFLGSLAFGRFMKYEAKASCH